MVLVVIDIGQGLGIDEDTLATVVLDVDVVRRELEQSEDPADRVVAALATGDTARAATELSAIESPGFRITALHAELAQAEGRYADAIATYELMLAELQPDAPVPHGPSRHDSDRRDARRATVLQHLGKAQWRAGDGAAAVRHLQAALQLRRTIGAPRDQLQSSQLALDHALALRRRQSPVR